MEVISCDRVVISAGNAQAALSHFEAASELDPDGIVVELARRA